MPSLLKCILITEYVIAEAEESCEKRQTRVLSLITMRSTRDVRVVISIGDDADELLLMYLARHFLTIDRHVRSEWRCP